MKDSIVHVGENLVFLKESGAIVSVHGNKYSGEKADASKPKDLKPPTFTDTSAGPWSVWGDDNLFPENVKRDIKKSIMIRRGIDSRSKMFYGKGIMPYILSYDASGKEVITPLQPDHVNYQEIKDFFAHSHISHYISSAIRDHEQYANIFPQLIFSKDKKKVNLIVARKARQCRWEKIDKGKGKILNCYESSNWPTPGDQLLIKYPVINMFDDVNDIRDDENKLSYIYRAMYPLSDNDYYAEAVWNSARESGWLEIESSIPALKKFQFQNQIHLKYHIEIPWDYFIKKSELGGKAWKQMSPEEKEKMKDDFYTQMNDYLSGKENAGKTFVSYFGYDPITKKEMPGIKITQIENPNQKGEYLEDIDQTNTQLSYALAWDRSLIGQSGKSMGAGSGSDKREAFLIATSMMRLDRDFIFEPLNFVRDYNNWDSEIQFGFPDMVLTTLDANPTGVKKTMNG